MFEDLTIDEPGHATHAVSEGALWLRIRKLGGVAEVDILGAESLFDSDDIGALGAQLRSLADDGADRLVLNFAGVRSISSDVLGILAALARRYDPSRGRIRVRGLDPMLLNMLRICRLDRVLEVEGCEPWTS